MGFPKKWWCKMGENYEQNPSCSMCSVIYEDHSEEEKNKLRKLYCKYILWLMYIWAAVFTLRIIGLWSDSDGTVCCTHQREDLDPISTVFYEWTVKSSYSKRSRSPSNKEFPNFFSFSTNCSFLTVGLSQSSYIKQPHWSETQRETQRNSKALSEQ